MIQNKKNKSLTIFIIVGRLGKSLTISKAAPIIESDNVEKVFIFREEKGLYLKDVKYITLPRIISNIKLKLLKKVVRFIYEPIQIFIYATRYKPDYINGVYTLPKGLNSLLVSKLVGIKSIISVIGGEKEITTYLPFAFFWKKLNLWILKCCSAVTTKGSKVSKYLIDKGINRHKIFVFNGSINTNNFKVDNNIKRNINILFVGNFNKLKGPDRVLKVVENIKKDFPEIKACFLGFGSLFESIKKDVERLKLTKNILLKGYVTDTKKYFQRAKILIMPSKSEGLSTAMLEAMACGCVPIVSNVGNMTDVALHNINAMVVDMYFDINTFTKYAYDLLWNNVKWKKMSKEGQKLVKERYSIEAQSKIFDSILDYGESLKL